MNRMRIHGQEVLVSRCDACGVEENLDLLDAVLDEDGNDRGELRCVACYGPNYCPPRSAADFRFSVAQSLTDAYERWSEAHAVITPAS